MRRLICVGDIHGCLQELLALLDACQFDKTTDTLCGVGDLLDRGPDPKGVVEFFMNGGHLTVMGNHEENILRGWKKGWQESDFRSPEHRRSFRSLERRHLEYLDSLPLYLEFPEHNVTVVHAGVVPEVEMHRQTPRILMHVQHLRPPQNKHGYWTADQETWWSSKAPEGTRYWAELYRESCLQAVERGETPSTIIYGHTGCDDPLVDDFSVGLDTGCAFGRTLTAVILPERRFVSVPAQKMHYGQEQRALDPRKDKRKKRKVPVFDGRAFIWA